MDTFETLGLILEQNNPFMNKMNKYSWMFWHSFDLHFIFYILFNKSWAKGLFMVNFKEIMIDAGI